MTEQRRLAAILVADVVTLLLYELYASKEAFDLHWNGPSIQQVRKEAAGLSLSMSGIRC